MKRTMVVAMSLVMACLGVRTVSAQSLTVKKINTPVTDAEQVPQVLDEANIPFVACATANWDAFPYKPKAEFRIAHTADAFLVQYKVTEDCVRAKYGNDMGSVYTDACMEFFSSPTSDGYYYNVETNCIGTVLLQSGTQKVRENAPQAVMDQIKRWSSLGREPFELRNEPTTWTLALIIPYSIYYNHEIKNLDGQTITANFYKCGDELCKPHYLSWKAIDVPRPSFHQPSFFGTLEIEK